MKLSALTKEDIRRELTPDMLRVTTIIQAAITAGPVLFFGVVLFMHYGVYPKQDPVASADLGLCMLLLQVLGVIALGTIVAAYLAALYHYLTEESRRI